MVKSSQDVALQVIQQAIAALAKWAKFDHPSLNDEYREVSRAKQILGWNENTAVGILRLLFDKVNLCNELKIDISKLNYHQLKAINNDNSKYPDIPYPLNLESIKIQQDDFKVEINQTFSNSLKDNWENLPLLMLILDKFGSCLSFGESDVALVDMARATAAVAAALVNNSEAEKISLIAGDLSGIQNFIYTISSDGALKSLRARSFYLELVTEEIVQQLLEELDLPRTSIIYAGGGNLYLLAAANKKIEEQVRQVQHEFNKWLKNEFQSKVFLALDCISFSTVDVGKQKFSYHWNQVIQQLNKQKQRKFDEQINDLLAVRNSYGDRCRVCHRDDTTDLEQLNPEEDDSVLACPNCREMFQLGSQLFKTKAVVRSRHRNISSKPEVTYLVNNSHYFLFDQVPTQQIQNDDILFLINNWKIRDYQVYNSVPLLLGNYGKESCENPGNFIRAHELAKEARGIKKVGYLRMDVDNLGKIFAKGLSDNHTLPRLAGLSRQMSYFFKVYLNSLANNRKETLPKNPKTLTPETNTEKFARLNLLFIYAGGDDLFVSGAWDELVEFAFDVYQSFRAYTGHNPYITLSGGISINAIKYPLYQAASDSGESENKAKANNRDSLALFGEAFKWDEWLGQTNVSTDNIKVIAESKLYISKKEHLELFGILPFVKNLLNHPDLGYPQSFIRNLWVTAEVQELALQEAREEQKNDVKYFLHLPKLAYAMSKLSQKLRNYEDFVPIRQSFMSPYNAPYFRAIATWIELLTRSQNL
ncbi:type III-A CRISPR-associated protein Cas10/Csm1 [Dendronalium sp. ChiSLP03b]|uniref:type III-A CRISPR-associated protein Cas10/Csm1 n=1 Tax=Dendronalium sp. ChiSLP03b TaxID=3075381 RepID=UPI002AD477B7|nr:type III-A CRISPR-associated protein Cas10/Csm1 [Dendronalium sp. ChiSLP03b]MDZ8206757.1 type III-A CRISPR-associated protein Cas10/Csm1 [Dendronalium sp. ChiSLP03b]